MGLRGRLHLGPALRRLRLPVRSTLVSVIFHAAFGAAVLWGNAVWGGSEPKPVIVNLVPAIAAVGVPQGRQQPEQLPPPRPTPTDLPQREPSRDLPARDLPARDQSPGLPDPGLPPRAPGLPRPSDKELPTVTTARAAAPTPVAPPPAPPLGQIGGSPQGVGALTLDITDFPYAGDIAVIHRKVKEQWDGYALSGPQPAGNFEISPHRGLQRLVVPQSSRKPNNDQAGAPGRPPAQ